MFLADMGIIHFLQRFRQAWKVDDGFDGGGCQTKLDFRA